MAQLVAPALLTRGEGRAHPGPTPAATPADASASLGSAPPARRGARERLADLSVRVRVLGAVGIVAIVAIVIGLIGLHSLSNLAANSQNLYRNNVVSEAAIGRLFAEVGKVQVIQRDAGLAPTPEETQAELDKIPAVVDAFNEAIGTLRGTHPSTEMATLIDRAEELFKQEIGRAHV